MTGSVRSVGSMRLVAVLAVLIAVCVVALSLPVPAHAANSYYVATTGNDTTGNGSYGDPYATIGKALSVASSGDAIIVGPGTFNGPVNMNTGVSLHGAGASFTTLQGNGTQPVITASNIGAGATVSGFTIIGGGGSTAGGIYCYHSSPTITGDTIQGNVATGGGGILCMSSSPVITANVITGNSVTGYGGGIQCADSSSPTIEGNIIIGNSAPTHDAGGIFCAQSSPTIEGNEIAYNSANAGGGIECYSCSPTIRNNAISGNGATTYGGGINCEYASPTITGNSISLNSAASEGGGIYCVGPPSPTITDNTITGNSATGSDGFGAGIYCESSSPAITRNTITANSASGDGGGICCYQASPAITGNTVTGNSGSDGAGIACLSSSSAITDNTISGNSTDEDGGGIYFGTGSATIARNTIVGNTAGHGGGIWCSTDSAAITNNVIAASSADGDGGGIYLSVSTVGVVSNDTIAGNSAGDVGGGIYCGFGTPAVTNCIVWDNSSALSGCSATYSDVSAGSGSGDISVDPAFASAATGDYHLSASSPCIDVATPSGTPATDRDGIARPWGHGYDIGAYEYFVSKLHTATSLSVPGSVKVKKSLRLTGTVSPSFTPGRVTIAMTRKVGKKWKGAGSLKVTIPRGEFSYSYKPKYKGSWHFVAIYSGGVAGPTTYLPSVSAVKGVKVK